MKNAQQSYVTHSFFSVQIQVFSKCYCTFRCKVQGHLARLTSFVQFYFTDCVKLNKMSNLNADEGKVGGVSVGTPLRQVNLTLSWWAFNQFHRSPLSTILSKIFHTLKGQYREMVLWLNPTPSKEKERIYIF
jgi:hypothetical protein